MTYPKIFILISLCCGCLPGTLQAQQLSDSSLYNPGIIMIEKAKTAVDYAHAETFFEERFARDPSQWLCQYYAALCYIQESHKVEDSKARDALLDKAQPLIDRAVKRKPDEPELMILQAFLYQSRIEINPKFRGMTYSSKAEDMLKKATATDGNNPRAWSLLGYNTFYTPGIFGGGPEKALPLFMKADDKFKSFKPVLPFFPCWGKTENQQMIVECKNVVN